LTNSRNFEPSNEDDTDTSVGVKVGVGAAWQFTKTIAAFGEYRFTHFSPTRPAQTLAAASPSGKNKSVTLGGVAYADHGTKDVRNLSKLELEADDYYFSPTFLRGKPGQKLTLLVENEASTLHNIRIPALGIDNDVPPKGKVQVDVTFPPSGMRHPARDGGQGECGDRGWPSGRAQKVAVPSGLA
jgi:hypothetical protein